MSTNKEAISTDITQFYQDLYQEGVSRRPMLDGLEFSMISNEDSVWLGHPFKKEEVLGVIQGFNGDKAPGPDGFSMASFKLVGLLFIRILWLFCEPSMCLDPLKKVSMPHS